jgi:hypothetical protein
MRVKPRSIYLAGYLMYISAFVIFLELIAFATFILTSGFFGLGYYFLFPLIVPFIGAIVDLVGGSRMLSPYPGRNMWWVGIFEMISGLILLNFIVFVIGIINIAILLNVDVKDYFHSRA